VQAGLIDVKAREYTKTPWVFNECSFIPTGWDWVDPLKEVKAANEGIAGKIESRTDIVQAKGRDDEEMQEQILQEQMRDADNEKLLKEYRKSLGLDEPPPKPEGEEPEEDDEPEEDEEQDDE